MHEVAVMPDHVHVIVGDDPSFGIMRLVRLTKGRTCRLLRQEYRPLRPRVPTLWTNARLVATTGDASLDVIKQYVESQRARLLQPVHRPPEQTSYTASASRYRHSRGEMGGGRRASGSGREPDRRRRRDRP